MSVEMSTPRRSASTVAKSDPAILVPTASDVPDLIALVNVLAGEPNFLFINPIDPVSGSTAMAHHFDAISANGNEAVLIARRGAEIVGLVTGIRGAHVARRGAVEIGLGVRAECRRHGVGRALMLGIERWARGVGCNRLQLRVVAANTAAVTLYTKLGFAREGVLCAAALVAGQYLDELQMAKLLF